MVEKDGVVDTVLEGERSEEGDMVCVTDMEIAVERDSVQDHPDRTAVGLGVTVPDAVTDNDSLTSFVEDIERDGESERDALGVKL